LHIVQLPAHAQLILFLEIMKFLFFNFVKEQIVVKENEDFLDFFVFLFFFFFFFQNGILKINYFFNKHVLKLPMYSSNMHFCKYHHVGLDK